MLPGGIARGAHACKSGSSPRCVASGAAGSAGRARGEQLPAAAAGALQQEDSACGGCSSRSELAEQAVRHAAHARSGQEGLAAGPLGSRRRGGLAVQQRGRGGPFPSTVFSFLYLKKIKISKIYVRFGKISKIYPGRPMGGDRV